MFKSILTATVACATLFTYGESVWAGPQHTDASSSASGGYILNIDEDGPGADALTRGDFATAAAEASAYLRPDASLSVYLTLCAANIGLGELDAAQRSCDAAVELAAKPLTTNRKPHGHANREGLAKAHSNRGVFRALNGDLSGARADFARASKQRRFRDVVNHNVDISTSTQALATSQ